MFTHTHTHVLIHSLIHSCTDSTNLFLCMCECMGTCIHGQRSIRDVGMHRGTGKLTLPQCVGGRNNNTCVRPSKDKYDNRRVYLPSSPEDVSTPVIFSVLTEFVFLSLTCSRGHSSSNHLCRMQVEKGSLIKLVSMCAQQCGTAARLECVSICTALTRFRNVSVDCELSMPLSLSHVNIFHASVCVCVCVHYLHMYLFVLTGLPIYFVFPLFYFVTFVFVVNCGFTK